MRFPILRGLVMATVLAPVATWSGEADISGPSGFRFPDEYRPDGMKVGEFIMKPSFEISGGYTDDAREDGDPAKEDGFTEAEARVKLQTDWDRNEIYVDLRGSQEIYASADTENTTYLDGYTIVTLDVTDRTKIELDAGASHFKQNENDPNEPDDPSEKDNEDIVYLAPSITQEIGKATFRLKGLIEDSTTENDSYDDGSGIVTDDEDYVHYEARLRASYEVNTRLTAFVEGSYNERDYEQRMDTSDNLRGSHGYGVFAGAEIRLADNLEAKVAAGVRRQNFDEATFDTVLVPTLDAWIKWQATDDTALTLEAETEIEESDISDVSAEVKRTFSARVDHALRENVLLYGLARYTEEHFRNTTDKDRTYLGRVGLEYAYDKYLRFNLQYEYEQLVSDFDGDDFSSNRIVAGMKVSR